MLRIPSGNLRLTTAITLRLCYGVQTFLNGLVGFDQLQGFLAGPTSIAFLIVIMYRHIITIINNKVSRYIAKTIILFSPTYSTKLDTSIQKKKLFNYTDHHHLPNIYKILTATFSQTAISKKKNLSPI